MSVTYLLVALFALAIFFVGYSVGSADRSRDSSSRSLEFSDRALKKLRSGR